MAAQLVSQRAIRPARAAVRTMSVESSTRISPGFQRVHLASTGDGFEDDFDYLGFDQWFRLFLPADDGELRLPLGDGAGWYARWLAEPKSARAVVRNYTIRHAAFDGARWHLEVDFVLHPFAAADGQTGMGAGGWAADQHASMGVAAAWASRARPGERVGFLDQGRMFCGTDHRGPVVVAADSSGLPAAEAIARDLAGRAAHYLLCVPEPDHRMLPDARPRWYGSNQAMVDRLAGTLTSDTHLFAVGEASMVLTCRRLAQLAGVPDHQIDFCAYWRPNRRADL